LTSAQAAEAEIKAVAGELVGLLRIISEGVTPLRRANLRNALLEAERVAQTCVVD
jgi:hypothetical protein